MLKNIIEERDRLQMAVRRMRIACWINKATHTHTHTTQYVIVLYWLLFYCNNGYKDVPQCYVIRTLHVLLYAQD